MPAGDQDRSFGREVGRMAGCPKRPGVSHRDAVVFVQFALPAVVEQAVRCVAMLLYFSQYDASADGVDGARRDVDDVTLNNGAPVNEISARAVLDRCTQLLSGYLVLQ